MNKIEFVARFCLFSIFWWGGVLLVCLIQLPAVLILWPWRGAYRAVMRTSQRFFANLLIVITAIFSPLKIVMTGCHQDLNGDSFVTLIANHQIYTDWWYVWLFSYFKGAHDSIKIMLIQILGRIPFMGWGMYGFEFIFLARKWNIDRSRIIQSLERVKNDKSGLWLLLFPEGTIICQETMDKSIAYSKKADIPFSSKHVLLPKCTGLFHALRSLASDERAAYLYDFTIGYSNQKSDQFAYDLFSPVSVFIEKKGPSQIHMHVNRFKILSIPGIDASPYNPDEKVPAEFEQWLFKRFKEKEKMLAKFYAAGVFPDTCTDSDSRGGKQVFEINVKYLLS